MALKQLCMDSRPAPPWDLSQVTPLSSTFPSLKGKALDGTISRTLQTQSGPSLAGCEPVRLLPTHLTLFYFMPSSSLLLMYYRLWVLE